MFSERFASTPPSSLPRNEEEDGAIRRGTEENDTAGGRSEEERRREIGKRGEAEDESYIYIYIEGERIQIAEESSRGVLGPRTIASDLSERAEPPRRGPLLLRFIDQ